MLTYLALNNNSYLTQWTLYKITRNIYVRVRWRRPTV